MEVRTALRQGRPWRVPPRPDGDRAGAGAPRRQRPDRECSRCPVASRVRVDSQSRPGRLPVACPASMGPLVTLARAARPLLTLALLVGVQTAYTNPAVVAAELRAMSCCGHCPGPASLPSARSCCGVTAVTSGPAEVSTSRPAAPLGPTALPLAVVVKAAPSWVPATLVQPTGSGPPTFLEQRHLLL